jgi:hypothetical protein
MMSNHAGLSGSDGPRVHLLRYDATGLAGKRLRLITDLPTSDAGDPQEILIGRTDVICLDDTPDVFHNVRVRPVDSVEIAIVGIDQVAAYDQD